MKTPPVSPEITDDQDVLPQNETEEGESESVKVKSEETVENKEDRPAERRYPDRERKKPDYYGDHACGFEEEITNIDYCYRLMCNVPQTYKEAVNSVNAKEWAGAMKEEMQSLKDNVTYTLTTLPEGKDVVGGKWVYAMKKNNDGSDKFKARYVAKGFSQKRGVNYDETFSPTASMTSIRVLAQKAAQDNMIVHQMDVKTAYLHAPIECELYIEQPEGYEVKSKEGDELVCKLEKSLYGL